MNEFPEDEMCSFYPCDSPPEYDVVVVGSGSLVARFCGPHLDEYVHSFEWSQKKNLQRRIDEVARKAREDMDRIHETSSHSEAG